MAGQDETSSEAAPKHTFETASPFYNKPATLSLFREHSTIEGDAIREPVTPEPEVATAKTDASLEASGAAATEPPAAAGKPSGEPQKDASEPAPVAVTGPRPRGLSLVAMLLAAVIGAITGFASAYLTRHFLDDTQTTLASLDQRLTAVNGKLTADEKKIDAAGSGGRDALTALEKRLGSVEKSASDALGLAQAAQTQAAQNQAAPSSNAEAQAGSPAPVVVAPVPMPDLTPLQARVDALEQRLMKLETTVNTPKLAERATQEPEAKPEPALANAPAIAIIAENLVQKIGSGAAFETELTALEKLGVDKTKLAALQPSAAKGVATAHALSDELTAITPTLLGSEKAASPVQEGVFTRLMDHAKNLVHVRKVGDLSGDDLSARIARVQNALAHDDVERALQEWSGFPETAKTTSAHWADAAKARISTLTAAKTIVSDAMTNLAKAKS
jgi:hypothetical protein